MEEATNHELAIAVIGIGITTILGVVAIFQAFRANRLNKRIVEKEKTLENSNIEVNAFNLLCDKIILFMDLDKTKQNKSFTIDFPFTFYCSNLSKKTAREVTIFFTLPKIIAYGGILPVSTREGVKIEVGHETKHLITYICKFDFNNGGWNPGIGISVNIPLSITALTNIFNSKLLFSDHKNKKIIADKLFDLGLKIDVVVSQLNCELKTKSFVLEIVDTKLNCFDWINEYNKSILKSNIKDKKSLKLIYEKLISQKGVENILLIDSSRSKLKKRKGKSILNLKAEHLKGHAGVTTRDGIISYPHKKEFPLCIDI